MAGGTLDADPAAVRDEPAVVQGEERRDVASDGLAGGEGGAGEPPPGSDAGEAVGAETPVADGHRHRLFVLARGRGGPAARAPCPPRSRCGRSPLRRYRAGRPSPGRGRRSCQVILETGSGSSCSHGLQAWRPSSIDTFGIGDELEGGGIVRRWCRRPGRRSETTRLGGRVDAQCGKAVVDAPAPERLELLGALAARVDALSPELALQVVDRSPLAEPGGQALGDGATLAQAGDGRLEDAHRARDRLRIAPGLERMGDRTDRAGDRAVSSSSRARETTSGVLASAASHRPGSGSS